MSDTVLRTVLSGVNRTADIAVHTMLGVQEVSEQLMELRRAGLVRHNQKHGWRASTEVASVLNDLTNIFNSDTQKSIAWFDSPNPVLGDVSPSDMMRAGRYERLKKFIEVGAHE